MIKILHEIFLLGIKRMVNGKRRAGIEKKELDSP
jgi:hypothetical protein